MVNVHGVSAISGGQGVSGKIVSPLGTNTLDGLPDTGNRWLGAKRIVRPNRTCATLGHGSRVIIATDLPRLRPLAPPPIPPPPQPSPHRTPTAFARRPSRPVNGGSITRRDTRSAHALGPARTPPTRRNFTGGATMTNACAAWRFASRVSVRQTLRARAPNRFGARPAFRRNESGKRTETNLT